MWRLFIFLIPILIMIALVVSAFLILFEIHQLIRLLEESRKTDNNYWDNACPDDMDVIIEDIMDQELYQGFV